MIGTDKMIIRAAGFWFAAALLVFGALEARAQDAVTIEISIHKHRFQPAEVQAPAGKPITLRIKNGDATPAEFESVSLRVEKVIAANSEGIIRLRPLQPGRYRFFDDFNQQAQGALVVR